MGQEEYAEADWVILNLSKRCDEYFHKWQQGGVENEAGVFTGIEIGRQAVMVVTEPRLANSQRHDPRNCHLVTVLSPDPAGGAAKTKTTGLVAHWVGLLHPWLSGAETLRRLRVASTTASCSAALPASSLNQTPSHPSLPPTMAMVVPPEIPVPVPSFFEPLLSSIASCLPPPVFNALLTLLAHGMAFLSALIGLGSALISSRPSDWDAQKIIPPLITLLAAYLALASAVRTATWFVRTTAWLVKWGFIMAVLSATVAWVMGGSDGAGGIVPNLIAMVWDRSGSQGQDAAAASSRGTRQRSRPRPQAWDSYDQHWEWQFEEQQWNAANPASPAAHVQDFVADALDRARDGSWLSIARSALRSFSTHEQTRENEDESHER